MLDTTRAARQRGGGNLRVLVAVVLAAAAVYGGYRAMQRFGGNDCYFLMREDDRICVTTRAPDAQACLPAVHAGWVRKGAAACFPLSAADQADDFVKVSGKRLCGEFAIREVCR